MSLGYGFAGVVALYVLYNLTYAGLSYPARSSSRTGSTARVVLRHWPDRVHGHVPWVRRGWQRHRGCGCCSRSMAGTPRSLTASVARLGRRSCPPVGTGYRVGVHARDQRCRPAGRRRVGRPRLARHWPCPLRHLRRHHRRPRRRLARQQANVRHRASIEARVTYSGSPSPPGDLRHCSARNDRRTLRLMKGGWCGLVLTLLALTVACRDAGRSGVTTTAAGTTASTRRPLRLPRRRFVPISSATRRSRWQDAP